LAASKRAEVATRLREVEPRRFVVYAVFLLIFVFFAATLHDDGFLSHTNLLNILRQTTPITVGSPCATGLPGNDEIHLSIAKPPPSAGIARKSPAG
jgi:ribose transport system permease protein